MRLIRMVSGMGLSLALAAFTHGTASAGDPFWSCPSRSCPSPEAAPAAPSGAAAPAQPAAPGTDQAAPQTPDNAFAQAPAAGTGAESGGNPNIMGDFLRIGARFQGQGFLSSSSSGSFNSSSRVTVVGGGPLKIAENENVRPLDRVFLSYNGYSSILPGVNADHLGQINYQYETVGFEKTCFDGRTSFGIRVPVYELTGQLVNEETRFGDISLLAKLQLAGDGAGDAVSAGLVLTLPTGLQPTDIHGQKIHSFVWQPWWGVVTSLSDDLYFQGFNSLAIPSERRDAMILFLDGAVGYWAYRGEAGGGLTGIVPTSEVHFNYPLTNRGEHNTSHSVNVPTSVDLTEGVHFLFGRCSLSVGVSFCVTGPSLYDVEGIAQLNIAF